MTVSWQDVAALLAVLAAALYLARGFLPLGAAKPPGGCATGGCSSCPLSRRTASATIGEPVRLRDPLDLVRSGGPPQSPSPCGECIPPS